MEERVKQRILGGLVIAGLICIILSFLFHNSRPTSQSDLSLNNAGNNTDQTTAQNAQVALPAEAPAAPAIAQATPDASQAVQTAQVAPTPAANPAATPAAPTLSPSVVATTPAAATPATNAPVATPTVQTSEPSEQPGLTSANPNNLMQAAATATAASQATPAAPAQPVVAAAAPSVENPTPKQTIVAQHQAKRQVAMHKGAWVIQLGAFSEPANAKKLVARLRAKHFDAYVHHINENGKTLAVVFVGPEISQQKSMRIKNELESLLHLNGVVKKYEL